MQEFDMSVCKSSIEGVSISICDLDSDQSISLSHANSVLSQAEHIRAKRFHFARDHDRFIRGRGFLRMCLSAKIGISAAQLSLEDGKYGKPSLTGNETYFNLSHSGNIAVIALSLENPIGIDVELIDRQVDVLGLMDTCFGGNECTVLSQLTGAELYRHFFAFWTAKEARMKLTGEGMTLSPKLISLDLDNGWPVGYLAPQIPNAELEYIKLPVSNALCCVSILKKDSNN